MRDSNTAPIQEEPVLNDSITWGGTDVHKECLKVTAPDVARTKGPPKNWSAKLPMDSSTTSILPI